MAWGSKLNTSKLAMMLPCPKNNHIQKKKKKSYEEVFTNKAKNTTISFYSNRHQKKPRRKALHDKKKDQTPLLASHATAHPSPFSVTKQMT